jgi:hypothetical protein
VGEEGDGRSDDIDDTDGQGTTLQTVAESHEGVSSLTRLGDENTGVISEHGCLSVQEVGGQLDGDGDLGQLLETSTDCHTRVVGSTTGNEDDSTATADSADVLAETTEGNTLVGNVQTTTHGVNNGLGLLENLLLHEVVELSLHNLLELELKSLDRTDGGGTLLLTSTVNVELTLVNVSDIIVLKVENLLGVLNDGGGVGGEEELGGNGHSIVGEECSGLGAVEKGLVGGSQAALRTGTKVLKSNVVGSLLSGERARVGELDVDKVDLHLAGSLDSNDQGRSLTGSDNLVGVVDGLHQQTESTLKLRNDGLSKSSEVDVGVLVVDVLGELRNALGVGLGLENISLALEKSLELLVVGDDTVVDDGETGGRVGPDEKLELDTIDAMKNAYR